MPKFYRFYLINIKTNKGLCILAAEERDAVLPKRSEFLCLEK